MRPAARFSPNRLGHLNIFVGELKRSMSFYERACGLEDVGREEEIFAGFLSSCRTHHDVGCMQVTGTVTVGRDGHVQVAADRGKTPGLNHLGWEMETEQQLVEAYRRFVDSGYGAHRTSDHQLAHSVYAFDPDGNLHEFYADVMLDWRKVMHGGSLGLVTGNWDPLKGEPHRDNHTGKAPRSAKASVGPLLARVERVALVCKDLAAMKDFFQDVAGMRAIEGSVAEGCIGFAGGNGEPCLRLSGPVEGVSPGMHHCSFELDNRVGLAEAREALARMKITVEREIDDAHKRSLFVRDPDGIRIEMILERRGAGGTPARPDADALFLL